MRKSFLPPLPLRHRSSYPGHHDHTAEAQNTTVVVKKKPGKHVYRGIAR